MLSKFVVLDGVACRTRRASVIIATLVRSVVVVIQAVVVHVEARTAILLANSVAEGGINFGTVGRRGKRHGVEGYRIVQIF